MLLIDHLFSPLSLFSHLKASSLFNWRVFERTHKKYIRSRDANILKCGEPKVLLTNDFKAKLQQTNIDCDSSF